MEKNHVSYISLRLWTCIIRKGRCGHTQMRMWKDFKGQIKENLSKSRDKGRCLTCSPGNAG